MKKYLIGSLIACLLLGLGVSAFIIVDKARMKSMEAKIEEKLRLEEQEKKEKEEELEPAPLEEVPLEEPKEEVPVEEAPVEEEVAPVRGKLDLSTVDSFLTSYSNVVEETSRAGGNIIKVYSTSQRAMLDQYSVGNLQISVDVTGRILAFSVLERSYGSILEEVIDEECEIKESNGNTYVTNITYIM